MKSKKCVHGNKEKDCKECRMISLYDTRLSDVKKEVALCMNEPTHSWLVGETVQYGNCSLEITEKIDNKIYIGKNEQNDIVICPWFELYVPICKEKLVKKQTIQIQYLQQSIDCFITYQYHFGLDMNADYQRGNVWSETDEQNLIESIFNDIEIGKFCLIRRDYSFQGPLYEVLDGKQRITTLIRFIEGKFKFKGYFYHELSRQDRWHFETFPIVVGITQELTKKQKYEYFLCLNVAGVPQDLSHIELVKQKLKKAI